MLKLVFELIDGFANMVKVDKNGQFNYCKEKHIKRFTVIQSYTTVLSKTWGTNSKT